MNRSTFSLIVMVVCVSLFYSAAANAHWLGKAESSASKLMRQVMNKTEAARDYLDDTAEDRQGFYRDLNSEAEKAYGKSKEYIDENKDDWHQAYNSTEEKIKQGIEGAQRYVHDHEGEWRVAFERVKNKIKSFFSDLFETWNE